MYVSVYVYENVDVDVDVDVDEYVCVCAYSYMSMRVHMRIHTADPFELIFASITCLLICTCNLPVCLYKDGCSRSTACVRIHACAYRLYWFRD